MLLSHEPLVRFISVDREMISAESCCAASYSFTIQSGGRLALKYII